MLEAAETHRTTAFSVQQQGARKQHTTEHQPHQHDTHFRFAPNYHSRSGAAQRGIITAASARPELMGNTDGQSMNMLHQHKLIITLSSTGSGFGCSRVATSCANPLSQHNRPFIRCPPWEQIGHYFHMRVESLILAPPPRTGAGACCMLTTHLVLVASTKNGCTIEVRPQGVV